MASALEGLNNLVRREIAKGFRNQLVKGKLRREVKSSVDEFGDPVPGSVEEYDFEGIRDSFSLTFAALAGIPTTDVRILIIAGLLNTTPQQDDKIRIRGTDGTEKWYQVRALIAVDPALAHYQLQCFEIPDPT